MISFRLSSFLDNWAFSFQLFQVFHKFLVSEICILCVRCWHSSPIEEDEKIENFTEYFLFLPKKPIKTVFQRIQWSSEWPLWSSYYEPLQGSTKLWRSSKLLPRKYRMPWNFNSNHQKAANQKLIRSFLAVLPKIGDLMQWNALGESVRKNVWSKSYRNVSNKNGERKSLNFLIQ